VAGLVEWFIAASEAFARPAKQDALASPFEAPFPEAAIRENP
jgi:hypothetical protein